MAVKLPYLPTAGLISKVLAKIQEARRPDRFTTDFLETKLGYKGGSARACIPLLKRMGFLSTDGTPTRLYDQYRNSDTQGPALAQGTRNAYSEIFDRNSYANDLTREKLQALVTEMTGLEKESTVVRQVVATFLALKDGADFESSLTEGTGSPEDTNAGRSVGQHNPSPDRPVDLSSAGRIGLNIGYTINLNLPETTNPDVFNAIFKSLRENLLKE